MRHAEVIYFSPHLDDAVFSCGNLICRQTHSGASVAVVTIFSANQRLSELRSASYQHRITEDIKAVTALQADYHYLNRMDAPARNSFYCDLTSIFFGMHPSDAATVLDIKEAMERALEESGATEAYFPLGVGGHIDHRITFAASQLLAFNGKKHYYEDRPYVFLAGHPGRRLQQLGLIESAARDSMSLNGISRIAQAARVLLSMPKRKEYSPTILDAANWARHYLKGSSRSAENQAQRLIPRIVTPERVHSDKATAAVGCYPTQIAAIAGDMSRWLRRSKEYSLTFGEEHSERYWSTGL